jgi:hypothetical protein
MEMTRVKAKAVDSGRQFDEQSPVASLMNLDDAFWICNTCATECCKGVSVSG